MSALEVVNIIKQSSTLRTADFRYCLVSSNKHPIKLDETNARPNNIQDFVEFSELEKCSEKLLSKYAGIGVSIQASNVTAIDVDKCFTRAFDISSADDRAIQIIEMFLDKAYIEFSFSGHGLRIFYRQPEIEDYSTNYYTKAENFGIEYYQPSGSFRYVTITGRSIIEHDIDSKETFGDTILSFLNKYMKRKHMYTTMSQMNINENMDIDELLIQARLLCFKNIFFQDRWFDESHYLSDVPGKSRESHHDYQLMTLIYENITHDRDKLRLVFEASPYFKTKDRKHIKKWTQSNYRYFNFVFDEMLRIKGVKK